LRLHFIDFAIANFFTLLIVFICSGVTGRLSQEGKNLAEAIPLANTQKKS